MAVQDGYGKSSGSESLVFAYDLKDTVNSYRGEPTTNLVATIATYYGGNVSTSYANGQYKTSAIVINGTDNTVPSGNFSQVSGTTTDTNSQTYWTIQGNAVVNESNQTVSFSVYLKGSGTCHLATYNDQCCYQLGPDITLTSTWTRYTITKSLTTFADYHWVAVRGITTSTNVFISSAQWERNSHSTPYTTTSRSNTQGLLDLTGNGSIDLSRVSFDSNAQMTFDGTDDWLNIPTTLNAGNFTYETIMRSGESSYQIFAAGFGNPSGGGTTIQTFVNSSGALINLYAPVGAGGWVYGSYSNISGYVGVVNTNRHIVVVNSGTNWKTYVNGNLVGDVNFYTPSVGNEIGVARVAMQGVSTIPTSVEIVKIYNRALTSTEITNNYLKYKRQYGLT